MSKPRHPDDGTMCPQWKKACSKVCHSCAWWNLVLGKNPQTGQDVNQWSCAIALLPMLTIESTLAQRQTMATVQELRNDVQKNHDTSVSTSIASINQRLASRDGFPAALSNGAATKLIEG